MYEHQKKQRIARIIEVAIPISIWDMFEDLLREYKTPERVIIESIKAHHRQIHGSLEDITSTKPLIITVPSPNIAHMPLSITDGKIAKMAENGKKIDKITQKKLEKIDELLEKVKTIVEESKHRAEDKQIKEGGPSTQKGMIEKTEQSPISQPQPSISNDQLSDLVQQLKELTTLKDITREIQNMKMILKRLESSGFSGGRRRRANLDLNLTITEASSTDTVMSPPERPLLESVLDSILLTDDEEDEQEQEQEQEQEKNEETN